jgi:hypothetical protein
MGRDELQLRRIVQKLASLHGEGPEVATTRRKALRALTHKVAAMRALVDDCLSGRNGYEQSMMEYRIRVEFPLYSHIGTLTALSTRHLDWF